jgi:hypothetical protein
MTLAASMKRFISYTKPRRLRRAASLIELLVAFTLLTTVLSVSAQMMVRHNRLLTAQRNYRIALDELSNQIDRLSALPADELPQAMSQLAPSAFANARLPGAELTGQIEPAEIGEHMILKLSWNESQRRHSPVALATWIFATPSADSPSIGSATP